MKRSRSGNPALKHLAFFEVLGDNDEQSPASLTATAGLLALRLVDHWVLAGSLMVEPESVSVRSVRSAIMALPPKDPLQEVLLGLVNTMQTLREVDVQPVLPRLFAYAGLLERRGMLPLAADVYDTVVRFGDEAYDGDLLIDSFMRSGYCRRLMGDLQGAEEAYASAGKMAKRRREPARELHSQIGIAKVAMERGNLPAADELLGKVVEGCAARGFGKVQAMALHDRSNVALKRGEHVRAVCMAYEALQLTDESAERERVLSDIAATFVRMGRYEEARTALLVLEATSIGAEFRQTARVNLMSLAARTGDASAFASYRTALQQVAMPPEMEANFLIESARGLRRFGRSSEAEALLESAREISQAHGLNRAVFEAEEMLSVASVAAHIPSGAPPIQESDPAARVADGLRQMLAAAAD